MCTHKKHSELTQYAITSIVVSSVSLVSSTPGSPRLSAMTDQMNRHAPSEYIRLKHLVFWFMRHLGRVLSSSVHVLSYQIHQEFLYCRNTFRNWCSDQRHIFALSCNNNTKSSTNSIRHGIITSSVRQRLPCKY